MIELKELHIKNFASFRKADLILDNKGLLFVEGENRDDDSAESNASGKSNLLSSIGWCLTGRTPDGRRYDEVIFSGEKSVSVKLDFNICSLERRRGSKAGIYINGRKTTQDEVNELFGIDPDLFYSSTFLGQDFISFFDMKPAARKELLMDFLPGDIISECNLLYDRAKKWLKDDAEDKIRIETKLQTTKRQLEELGARVDDLKNKSLNFEKSKEEFIRGLEKEKEKVKEEKRAELEKVEKKLLEVGSEIKKLKTTLTKLNKHYIQLQKDFSCIKGKELGLFQKFTSVRTVLSILEKEKKKLLDLKVGKCPVCKSDVTEEHKKKCIKEVDSKISVKRKEYEGISKELEKVRKQIAEIEPDVNDLDRDVRSKELELERKDSSLKRLTERKELLKKELERVEIEYDKRILEKKNSDNVWERERRLAVKKVVALEAEVEKLTEELEAIEEDRKVLEIIRDMCGSTGIQAALFDQFVSELQSMTNSVLETIGSDLSVEYTTQKETKKGTVLESLEINVYENGELCLGLSGGQRQKVRIASSLALAEMSKNRSGKELGFMLLDEPHRGLDRAGQQKLFEIFLNMLSYKPLIIVASPQSDFKSMFSESIKVVKEDGESFLL